MLDTRQRTGGGIGATRRTRRWNRIAIREQREKCVDSVCYVEELVVIGVAGERTRLDRGTKQSRQRSDGVGHIHHSIEVRVSAKEERCDDLHRLALKGGVVVSVGKDHCRWNRGGDHVRTEAEVDREQYRNQQLASLISLWHTSDSPTCRSFATVAEIFCTHRYDDPGEFFMPNRHWILLLVLLCCNGLTAQTAPDAVLTQYGAGAGPRETDNTYQLLDEAKTPSQNNTVAFSTQIETSPQSFTFRCDLHVDQGGDGGGIAFLHTSEYGTQGPAPFVKDWTQPNLTGSFAVGIDVHNPPNEEPFGPWGNYQGLPEREISLHWDGREIVKRVAPEEFRGKSVPVEIEVLHVAGGAEVTVRIAGAFVYERYFIAELHPYRSRLALGAATRTDATTRFDIQNVVFTPGSEAPTMRPPLHVEVFHHVMTDNKKTTYDATVSLPPLEWEFARVILTLDIHDGGKMWDEWDRNGEISVWDQDGNKRGIVPFITSYRTPCHWKVDVTHFRPYLTGDTKFEIAAGTTFYKNRGYAMSVAIDFYHGSLPLEPEGIIPLWNGTAKYKSAENHFQDFFPPQSVAIPAEAKAARVFMTTTGHSQVGEFTPSSRSIVFRPQKTNTAATEHRFENLLWKTDCYLNPNRPQFGTWKYSRAGWAPGDVVHPWWIDLTPHVQVGTEAELRYEPQPYDFGSSPNQPSQDQINAASHVVRSYLILYGEAKNKVAAPILRITNVVGDSAAAKAGVKQGDYLASYDGKQLDSVEDLRGAIQAAVAAGKENVPVVVFRGSTRLEVDVAPGRMGVNLSTR